MNRALLFGLSLLLAQAACGEEGRRGKGAPDAGVDFGGFDLGGQIVGDLVYAHTPWMLYGIDPTTLQLDLVGSFGLSEEVTDIAVDRTGRIIGITFSGIYDIDKDDATATFLADLAGEEFNGLSFIAAETGAEILVAASRSDGRLVQIDLTTGGQHVIGTYGNGWASSGDLVSVAGATYATVVGGLFSFTDKLVRVDPQTGAATEIGDTGVSGIWGLGYWRQKLFGFTETQGMVTIDVDTGEATSVAGTSLQWYGAGVTTSAPTMVQ